MRGPHSDNESLFTTVKLEDFVPAKHPLRQIRSWVNDALARMDLKFSAMYEADVKGGAPSAEFEAALPAASKRIVQNDQLVFPV